MPFVFCYLTNILDYSHIHIPREKKIVYMYLYLLC